MASLSNRMNGRSTRTSKTFAARSSLRRGSRATSRPYTASATASRMSERRRYGGPNRRPPWWPAGEAWPPPYGAWWYMRRRFLRRVGLLLGVLLALVLGASVLGAIAAGHWGGADHG